MSALTVILAPSGHADGVLAVLTDLSAANLIDPFLSVTPTNDSDSPAFTSVASGRSVDVTLQEIVAGEQVKTLRVCVLVPLARNARLLTAEQERAITETLTTSLLPDRTIRVRVLLARAGNAVPPSGRIAVDGWHNILISPEDGRGPGLGSVRLEVASTPVQTGRFAAPVIAGVVGLWSDIEHAPIDSLEAVPGEVVRLARSFYRKLETGEAENELRSSLLSQDGTLPLPSDARSPVVYVNDSQLAAQSMSDAFWRKHSNVLRGPRRTPEQGPARRQVSAGEALKLFFSFMWAAIKNAPAAWAQAIIDSVSVGIAKAIDRTVFGNVDSAYEVVFNRRTSRGGIPGWLEIGNASGQLSGALGDSVDPIRHNSRSDLSTVWQDYAEAAMTLADAGIRSGELPPVQVGVSRGIIPKSTDIVPGPDDRFTGIPGILAANIEIDEVDATDLLGIDVLQARLRKVETEKPDQALVARETLTALLAWRQRHVDSFGTIVGRRIADAFNATYQEVQELLRQLSIPVDQPPAPADSNKKLTRWIQLIAVMMLIAAGLATWLVVADHLRWYWAVGSTLVFYAFALALMFRAYLKAQKELFQLIHRRREICDQRNADEDNLRSSLRDLRRLSQAYSDYLAWSRALGAFLAAPLGPNLRDSQESLQISWGLPISTSIGYASPASDQLQATVGYLRSDLFKLGWLSEPWEQLVLDATPSLRSAGTPGVEDSPLWLQPGRGSDSVLEGWSNSLFTGEIQSTGADVAWREALERLTGSMSQLKGAFFSRVLQASGRTVSAEEFFSQIDMQPPLPSEDEFHPCLLSDLAVTRGLGKVKEDYRKRVESGLGTICVATQFSDAIPGELLNIVSAQTLLMSPDQSGAPANGEYSPPTPGEGFNF